MPAKDLWSQIQKQTRRRSEEEQLRILRRHLGELHDEWKGPYKDLRDRLRKRVARLEGHEAVRSRSGQQDPFHVKNQGDARVVLAGTPNAGKSSLVATLTGAAAVVADYPFATAQPIPGMLSCEAGVLQLVDTPPIIEGLSTGQGAGRPLLHLFTSADALIIVLDLSGDVLDPLGVVLGELSEASIHPIPGPVSTVLQPRGKGGVKFLGRAIERDQQEAALAILADAHMTNAEVIIRTQFDEDLLQRQADGELTMPTIIVGTHCQADDQPDSQSEGSQADTLREMMRGHRLLCADTSNAESLKPLQEILLEALGYTHVELLERPTPEGPAEKLMIHVASDIAAIAERANVSAKRLKGARVWGPSVPRPGQTVRLDHLVEAGDKIFLQS